MSLLGWTLTQFDWCLYTRRKLGHTETHRDRARTRRKGAVCKPRRDASGETRPAHTVVSSQTSSLRNWEDINVCCFSRPVCGLCHGGSSV